MIESRRTYKLALFPPFEELVSDFRICEADVYECLGKIEDVTGTNVPLDLIDSIEYLVHELMVGCEHNDCSLNEIEIDLGFIHCEFVTWITSLIEDELADEDTHLLSDPVVVENVDIIARTFIEVNGELLKHYCKSDVLLMCSWQTVSELIIHDLEELSAIQFLVYEHRKVDNHA